MMPVAAGCVAPVLTVTPGIADMLSPVWTELLGALAPSCGISRTPLLDPVATISTEGRSMMP